MSTPPSSDTAERPRVLVGIDGCAPSRAALSVAMTLARLANLDLTVAWAHHDSHSIVDKLRDVIIEPDPSLDFAGAVRGLIDPDQAEAVNLQSRTLDGEPRRALLAEAGRGYALVVVGANGCGDSADLGNTTLELLWRSSIPVLVVRHPPSTETDPAP